MISTVPDVGLCGRCARYCGSQFVSPRNMLGRRAMQSPREHLRVRGGRYARQPINVLCQCYGVAFDSDGGRVGFANGRYSFLVIVAVWIAEVFDWPLESLFEHLPAFDNLSIHLIDRNV